MNKENYKYCKNCGSWKPAEGDDCKICTGLVEAGCYNGTWSSANGRVHKFFEMETQHISNILHMFHQAQRANLTTENFQKILKARGEIQLPYVPYFPNSIELSIEHAFVRGYNG